MRSGILGAGMIGSTLGELWGRAGHEVVVRAPVVVGSLAEAWRFDPGTPPWNSNASAARVRAALGLEEEDR